jgi:hypothetical protein
MVVRGKGKDGNERGPSDNQNRVMRGWRGLLLLRKLDSGKTRLMGLE